MAKKRITYVQTRETREAAPIPDTPLPPIEPLPDDRNLVMCDVHDRPVIRVKGVHRFRMLWEGAFYEHFAIDAEGRWMFRPVR